jgi:hypothetical protein
MINYYTSLFRAIDVITGEIQYIEKTFIPEENKSKAATVAWKELKKTYPSNWAILHEGTALTSTLNNCLLQCKQFIYNPN